MAQPLAEPLTEVYTQLTQERLTLAIENLKMIPISSIEHDVQQIEKIEDLHFPSEITELIYAVYEVKS